MPLLPHRRLEVMKAYKGNGAREGEGIYKLLCEFYPHPVEARWGREGAGWSWAGWLRAGLGG